VLASPCVVKPPACTKHTEITSQNNTRKSHQNHTPKSHLKITPKSRRGTNTRKNPDV
jgi:hypothetical protein